ncbi:hypothetical protein LJC51_08145 [Lachnospiraceae bacterium OttesenSCG-928-J05]|nr:hypothetical protein [Lachnospiraceae bacterium OttesenSCG-928-J05]
MRSKQAFKNMMANMILQVIVFLSGIVLPRFFLEAYGSSVNGLITSTNQFLAYLSLAEAGVGTASVIALYRPLASNDYKNINSVLSATNIFYHKAGGAFAGLLLVLTAIFPYIASEQLPASMMRSMLLILGTSIFVEYYFLGKYKVFLQANQKGYVLSLVESVGTIATLVVSIILIHLNINVVLVKSVVTIVFILRFLVIRGYVRRKYPVVSFTEKPDYSSLHQRGAALYHQVIGVIVNNADVAILTVMLGTKSFLEVSVYGIYNLVAYAINILLSSFSNGMTAGFGEVISRDEESVLKQSFSSFEFLFYIVLFTVTTLLAVLILPFVYVYTINMSDVNYYRPLTAVLFVAIVFLQNLRIPSLTIISAAGHFKETRGQATVEAIIKIVVSLVLINKMGMNGVLLGTVCSYIYRSAITLMYNAKNLVLGSGKVTAIRIIRNTAATAVLIGLELLFVPQTMSSFLTWFIYATAVGIISFSAFVLLNLLFEPNEFESIKDRLKSVFGRK